MTMSTDGTRNAALDDEKGGHKGTVSMPHFVLRNIRVVLQLVALQQTIRARSIPADLSNQYV